MGRIASGGRREVWPGTGRTQSGPPGTSRTPPWLRYAGSRPLLTPRRERVRAGLRLGFDTRADARYSPRGGWGGRCSPLLTPRRLARGCGVSAAEGGVSKPAQNGPYPGRSTQVRAALRLGFDTRSDARYSPRGGQRCGPYFALASKRGLTPATHPAAGAAGAAGVPVVHPTGRRLRLPSTFGRPLPASAVLERRRPPTVRRP